MDSNSWQFQIRVNQSIMNRLSFLEDRVKELEKRVPYWASPEGNIFERNEEIARMESEGENE